MILKLDTFWTLFYVVFDSLFIVAQCVKALCLVLFCYAVLCVHSSSAIILMGKRERERWLLYFNCLPGVW